MHIEDIKNRLVAVLGFGMEGKAITKYLQKHGIRPTLFDMKKLEDFSPEEQEEIKLSGLNFIFGADCLKELSGFNYAFRSPGFWRLHPDIMEAERKGVVITSQPKWFFANCPATIIGVTGTKGKGTTCTLIYEMLKLNLEMNQGIIGVEHARPLSKVGGHQLRPAVVKTLAGKQGFVSQEGQSLQGNVYLTGNIGKTQPLDFLDDLIVGDIVVYELSSFQLQDLTQSPHISVVLMTTEEHLNHSGNVFQGFHQTLEEYHEAKSNITRFQGEDDITISNIDYPASKRIGNLGIGRKFQISKQTNISRGALIKDTNIQLILDTTQEVSTQQVKLRGKHNLENIAAASLTAKLTGSGLQAIESIINSFRGLEHRLELVHITNDIAFYNDSISTTPESTSAAIHSFTEPVILILGGSNKGLNYDALIQDISQTKHVKHVITIGEIGAELSQKLHSAGFSGSISSGAQNMAEIFAQISRVAATGDVILLSPGTASFDMFKNYPDRGNQFKKFALEWKSNHKKTK